MKGGCCCRNESGLTGQPGPIREEEPQGGLPHWPAQGSLSTRGERVTHRPQTSPPSSSAFPNSTPVSREGSTQAHCGAEPGEEAPWLLAKASRSAQAPRPLESFKSGLQFSFYLFIKWLHFASRKQARVARVVCLMPRLWAPSSLYWVKAFPCRGRGETSYRRLLEALGHQMKWQERKGKLSAFSLVRALLPCETNRLEPKHLAEISS